MNFTIQGTEWVKKIEKLYNSGVANAFVLCGNIGDYAEDTIKVDYYLSMYLENNMKMEEVAFFDVVHGTKYTKAKEDRSGESLNTICDNLTQQDIKRAYIINYPSLIAPYDGRGVYNDTEKEYLVNLHQTLTCVDFMNSENIIVFLCESVKDINPMLISSNTKISLIDITLPTENERIAFIKSNTADTTYKTNLSISQFAKLTSGLSLINIEDIVLQADDEGSLTDEMILDRKKELIHKEYSEIIELYDTKGFSLAKFAGQEHIKEYFRDVVINAIRDDNLSIVPKGVLLMGPPGTGKTYFSRCLAGDAGINFVEFKMSKILDKWVGEAEKRLEKAFSVFRALAPVGVFIDEIDQALSRGENDSNSVNKNLFGMFLSELAKPENRGKIVWLGATNYPDKIDEALKRSGRFDKKIPFFAPEEDERKVVFEIHLKKTGFPISADIKTNILAEKTDGYTQAEIENIVVKALELAKRKNRREINQELLELALEYMMTAQNNKIKEMEDIALLDCNDLEFLPQKYRQRLQELHKNKA